MPETTPLIKAALNLRGGAGFDVYHRIKGDQQPTAHYKKDASGFSGNVLLLSFTILIVLRTSHSAYGSVLHRRSN